MMDLLQVGVISSTHGVRGEVKVFPTTDDVKRFSELKEVEIYEGDITKTLHIENVKYFKQFAIVKFKEYNDINEVESIKGRPVYVTREHAVPLKKNEYFIADLIDMQVVDPDLCLSGKIKDVIKTGANDVYEIELMDGRELLLPAIKECILNVDMEVKIMQVHILEGLLE